MAGSVFAAKDDEIKIEATGILTTHVMAPGGETTGTILTVKDNEKLELDLKDESQQKLADELNGKRAKVKGMLQITSGVEVKLRLIVRVKELEAK